MTLRNTYKKQIKWKFNFQWTLFHCFVRLIGQSNSSVYNLADL